MSHFDQLYKKKQYSASVQRKNTWYLPSFLDVPGLILISMIRSQCSCSGGGGVAATTETVLNSVCSLP